MAWDRKIERTAPNEIVHKGNEAEIITDQRCKSQWRRQRVPDGNEMRQHEVAMVWDLFLHVVDPDGESCSTPFSTEISTFQLPRHINIGECNLNSKIKSNWIKKNNESTNVRSLMRHDSNGTCWMNNRSALVYSTLSLSLRLELEGNEETEHALESVGPIGRSLTCNISIKIYNYIK